MFLRNTRNWLFSDTTSYPEKQNPQSHSRKNIKTCTVLMRYNIRRQQIRVSTSRRVRDSTVPLHKKRSYVYTNVVNTQKPHVLHQSKRLHAYMNNTQIYLSSNTIPFINVEIKMPLEESQTNVQFFAKHIKSVCYMATSYGHLCLWTRPHNPPLNAVKQMPFHEISTDEQFLQKM